MTGNPAVIKSLQTALALEAHLNIQYRHDARVVSFMGVKKTVGKLSKLGNKAHEFMKLLANRILVLGGDTNYTVGDIVDPQGQPALTAIFRNELKLEMALVVTGRTAIQTAVGVGDEATAEKLRHIEERHEDAVAWLEKQLRLIAALGGEAEYIAEKI